jgi:hypothetical protein
LVNIENEGDSSIGKKPECLIPKLAIALNPMSFPAFHTSTMCSVCKLCSISKSSNVIDKRKIASKSLNNNFQNIYRTRMWQGNSSRCNSPAHCGGSPPRTRWPLVPTAAPPHNSPPPSSRAQPPRGLPRAPCWLKWGAPPVPASHQCLAHTPSSPWTHAGRRRRPRGLQAARGRCGARLDGAEGRPRGGGARPTRPRFLVSPS